MCTAPIAISRGGGTYTVRNTRPCGVSTMPLLPLRSRCCSSSLSGSFATSAALTNRCSPESIAVTTIAARRAARSVFNPERISRRMRSSLPFRGGWQGAKSAEPGGVAIGSISPTPARFARRPSPASREGENRPFAHLIHFFDQHPDSAAAGEANLPGGLVGNAEFQQLRLSALDHVHRLGNHRAFDAAAGNRTEKITGLVDNQVRADRPWRGAPGLHDRRKRDVLAFAPPVLGGFENVFIARQHISPLTVCSFVTAKLDPAVHHKNLKLKMDGRLKPGNDRSSVPCITPPHSATPSGRPLAPHPPTAPGRARPRFPDCGSGGIRQHATAWPGCHA